MSPDCQMTKALDAVAEPVAGDTLQLLQRGWPRIAFILQPSWWMFESSTDDEGAGRHRGTCRR